MKKFASITHQNKTQLPLIVEKDEDGVYVVECPLFDGCYSQGKTIGEAITNVREVISMALKEEENKNILLSYHPRELSLRTITV